jgi:hypothetical protein
MQLLFNFIQQGKVREISIATMVRFIEVMLSLFFYINPSGGKIFRTCPDWLWGPPSLLYNG